MLAAYCINWTEYERGWGHRPDGHTLHRSKGAADEYVKAFLARQPKEVPDEYSSPGTPFVVEVDSETHAKIEAEGTIWGHVRENRTPLTLTSGIRREKRNRTMSSKLFPIMALRPGDREEIKQLRESGLMAVVIGIPWTMIGPHESQARRNHGQSLERLAERGGLGVCEAVAVLENRPWERMPKAEACAALAQKLFEHIALPFPGSTAKLEALSFDVLDQGGEGTWIANATKHWKRPRGGLSIPA